MSKGCVWCEKNWPFLLKTDANVKIESFSGKHYLVFQTAYGGAMIPIFYCPVCGKELKEE